MKHIGLILWCIFIGMIGFGNYVFLIYGSIIPVSVIIAMCIAKYKEKTEKKKLERYWKEHPEEWEKLVKRVKKEKGITLTGKY